MERLILEILPQKALPRAARYGFTALIVAIFVLLRYALSEPLAERPFLLFFLPIFLASLLFDRGSGFLATFLCALAIDWLWLYPKQAFFPAAPGDVLGLMLFVGIGMAIAALTEALRKALEEVRRTERETALLLDELNHRVRNDLQMVATLLRLGRRDGRAAEQILDAAADRITVMSRVYGRLTRRHGTTAVNGKEFVESLIEDLRLSLATIRPVAISATIEPLTITLRCATAVGLIVNELVTNALKYAFPDGRPGLIDVQLKTSPEGLTPTVCDDGVGAPLDKANAGGLGTRLVSQLAGQHGGSVEFDTAKGFCARLHLPRDCLLGGNEAVQPA